MKYSILYKEYGLGVNSFTCYPWEMALSFGLDVSFANMSDRKGIWEKAGEAYKTHDEASH